MPSSPALRHATRNSSRYVRHDARTVNLRPHAFNNEGNEAWPWNRCFSIFVFG